QLPALVPDRHAHDQWAKRTEIKNPDLAGAAGFIFTFLKGASLKGSMRHDPFCTLTLSAEQQGWLLALEDEYGGLPLTDPPFDEAWFFDELAARGRRDVLYIHYFPHLYITAYALPQHFPMFRRTGPGDEDLNWADHLQGNWYSRTARGSCNFLKDTLWTTIPNATAPVAMLPSFQSLLSGGHQ
ncbi:MAG TPA: hypothetical protein VK907_12465, partial [Phnomibacter sp.]|nr:hypothetical protein [Phnomibacter sp.]